MSIIRKVRRVEKVFATLEIEIKSVQENSKISCLAGCGNCCKKPDIEASVLEFLPLAYYAFEQKKSGELLKKISSHESTICVIFNQKGIDPITSAMLGNCNQYVNRGLICRLFGFAASRDKYGQARLSTCKLIKTYHSTSFNELEAQIEQGYNVPFYSDYYQRMVQIDFRMAQEFHPINIAIKKAIEEVQSYYAYRPFPRKYKKVA